jgi:hypothetical protein
VVYLGFFGMPDLSFRAWGGAETYGGRYWTQMMSSYQKTIPIGACEKIIIIFSPPRDFFVAFGIIPFFRVSS